MPQKARFFTFLVFTLSFFTIAGALTFHTLGYRYSRERGVFVYTGSLTIAANPAAVSIIIDRQATAARVNPLNGSYHVAGLDPGEHFVQVSADGYRSWEKAFSVRSGVSTEFWNVLLTRDTYPQFNYESKPLAKVFSSPKSTLFATVSTEENGFSVDTLDTETKERVELFRIENASFDPKDKENIEWSVKSDFISIPAFRNGKRDYFIVKVDTKEVVDLQTILEEPDIRAVRWDSSRNTFLLALSGTNLFEIDIAQPENKSVLARNVQSYDISGNDLYIFEAAPETLVYKTSIDNLETRIRIAELPESAVASDQRFSVIAYDENRVLLINYFTGKLFLHNKDVDEIHETTLSSDAKGAQFSDDGKKLLWWTDREIAVFFTRNWETQPTRERNSSLTVGRFSRSIENIHWAKDYEHVTFSVDTAVKIAELDNRSERNLADIITLPAPPTSILSNFAENQLFYTLPNAEQSFRETFHSIDFPEKTPGFFAPGP